jgi:hypothetical protein
MAYNVSLVKEPDSYIQEVVVGSLTFMVYEALQPIGGVRFIHNMQARDAINILEKWDKYKEELRQEDIAPFLKFIEEAKIVLSQNPELFVRVT